MKLVVGKIETLRAPGADRHCRRRNLSMCLGQIETIDHQKLRSDLQKLHGELRGIKSLDEDEQRMLRLLDTDIEELLTREGDNLKPDPDARQRVSEALVQVAVRVQPDWRLSAPASR